MSGSNINKKIAIVLPSLVGGGAEKLAIYLANYWNDEGFNVTFVLVKKYGKLMSMVNPEIDIIDLKTEKLRSSFFTLRSHFKNNSYDVIWSGLWPLTSISILAWIFSGQKSRIFVIDHNHLSISTVKQLKFPKYLLRIILKITYPLATGIIAVSDGVKKDICMLGWLNSRLVETIYNPAYTGRVDNYILTDKIKTELWGNGSDKHIISVGSLKPQKNHKLLIKAFSMLENTNSKLIILGEGELESELNDLINKLNLSKRVFLKGFVVDPTLWYLSADLFVLSSNWEGLPTVLIEALECGLPIVSTNCPSGPDEILENGNYGKLVPMNNVNALSDAIKLSLMEAPHDPSPLTKRAKDFTIPNISRKYLEYFKLMDKKAGEASD